MPEKHEELAVIFDMDGLMIESEHRQSESLEHVLRHHGVEPEYNDAGLIQIVGVTARDNLARLKDRHEIDEPLESLLEMKNRVYSRILDEGVEPQPGLMELIFDLKGHDVPIAIASSSIQADIGKVLSHLELEDLFDAIVSGGDVEKGKPAPDIYLKAAGKLGVDVSRCVALEDAQSGVQAGKNAGMKVIAVPSRYSQDNDFSLADRIVDSLEKLSYQSISNLISR